MIESLSVRGYKSLLDTGKLRATNLNVLVGANASGKSSLLQMLLLLRQSAQGTDEVFQLHLSGALYEGGTVQDVLHPSAEHQISFYLTENSTERAFIFGYDREVFNPNSIRLMDAKEITAIPDSLASLGRGFAYLNAERIGPRVSYPLPSDEAQISGLFGKAGEFTTAVLARAKEQSALSEEAVNSLSVDDERFIDLIRQTPLILDSINVDEAIKNAGARLDLLSNIILGWIIPGAVFAAVENPQTDSAALRFVRDANRTKTEVRATHIGFGLSYTLPIIAAAFALDREGLLIVENPEAHLHPFSQSRIGAFLAVVASSGRQVFVETHSDHVVNGIRLATSKGLIDPDAICINFCAKSPDHDQSEIIQISLDKNGSLDKWPLGFFDQIENDLSRL